MQSGTEQRGGKTPGSQPTAGWPLSLLWPEGSGERMTVQLSASAIVDLGLEHIVHALDATGQYARPIRAILSELPRDERVIAYRQEILADLIERPETTAGLEAMLPELQALATSSGSNWPGDSPLMPVMSRLRELDRYVACIDRLYETLEQAGEVRSTGLRALRAGVAALVDDPDVVALRAEVPMLREIVGEAQSVTIGLNLDSDLEPESATIVELNRFQFKGSRSLLGRLLPGGSHSAPSGATPLHRAGPAPLRRDSQLYKDLQRLLESVVTPLGKALARYRDVNVRHLAGLEREFAFFTGAAALIARLQQARIPICRPKIAESGERAFAAIRLCNVGLALQMLAMDGSPANRLVANDAGFDSQTRLLVITGPNRGGKTTFCRALGQAQVLFQTGLYVPAGMARMSPVDGIWTHFPLPEADRPGAGRLDEEVQRLRRIFGEATDQSLVLLNEPLTSTSERDALVIAGDMLRAFQILGARVVLVTHLHDLALAIPNLNDRAPAGSAIRSLVAESTGDGDAVRGTFRILPGLPAGRSYAAEIARQHGMTFDQLQQLLDERDLRRRLGL